MQVDFVKFLLNTDVKYRMMKHSLTKEGVEGRGLRRRRAAADGPLVLETTKRIRKSPCIVLRRTLAVAKKNESPKRCCH